MHEDMNTILANLEKRLSLQAEREFDRARRYVDDASKEANIVSGHSPYMISQARLATAQGNRWRERAEVAAKGYFLATSDDLADPAFTGDFQDVIAQATKEGRIVHGPGSMIGEPIIPADIASAVRMIDSCLDSIGAARDDMRRVR